MAQRSRLLSTLLAARQDVDGYFSSSDLPPLHVEASTIAEQRPPSRVAYVDGNAKALRLLVVPLAHVRNTTEEHWKVEAHGPLVEALCTRTEANPTLLIHRQIDVDSQVLVRSEIVDDAAACFAVDHVRVEPARATRLERANPGNRLTTEPVDKRIILNRERDIASRFGEHDAAPRADVEERHRVEPALPDLFHEATADRSEVVGACEAKPPLDLRMQTAKVRAEDALVDGGHAASETGRRRQRAAEGSPLSTTRSIAARHATARFNEIGLNAAPRNRGELTATPTVATNIAPRHSIGGQRRRQKRSKQNASRNSTIPSIVNTMTVPSAATPTSRSMATSSAWGRSSLGTRP